MKTKHSLFACLVALFITASASAEAFKLKLSEAQQLAQAIAALDNSPEKIVKQGEGQPDKVVRLAYDISGTARLALFRNLRELNSQLDDFDKTRIATVKKIWGERTPDKDKDEAEFARFQKEFGVLLDTPIEVKLTRIKTDDLRLDQNPIPLTVLSALTPILN